MILNDAMHFGKETFVSYLEMQQKTKYNEIINNPAVLIVTEAQAETIYENFSNLYFVERVEKQNRKFLISSLIEKYELEEASFLLEDLNLPAVLEINFKAHNFTEMESNLFEESLEEEEGIFKVLYSKRNYTKSWQDLELINKILQIINKWYLFAYWGIGLLILVLVIYFRYNYEKRNLRYWKVYLRSGGDLRKRNQKLWLNSLLIVIIPAGILVAAMFYLFNYGILKIVPDFHYHYIRGGVLLAGSLLTMIFIRREDYDQIHT